MFEELLIIMGEHVFTAWLTSSLSHSLFMINPTNVLFSFKMTNIICLIPISNLDHSKLFRQSVLSKVVIVPKWFSIETITYV